MELATQNKHIAHEWYCTMAKLVSNDSFHNVGSFRTPQNTTRHSYTCVRVWVYEATLFNLSQTVYTVSLRHLWNRISIRDLIAREKSSNVVLCAHLLKLIKAKNHKYMKLVYVLVILACSDNEVDFLTLSFVYQS